MTIQTVAVFHAGASVVSAWNCAEGIVQTLEGMGFQTIDCGNPQQRLVDIELLKQVDLIILSGLEWYEPLIKQVYGARWLDIAAPKIAWYAESFHRDDREFYYSRTAMLADIHYFPAVQDAIEFGGQWLPFGVDLSVFRPRPVAKQFDVAFLGQLYPKRMEYIEATGLSLTHVRAGDDPSPRRSAELLTEAYCAISIFLSLPSYSRLLVTKVSEVMACRTMLITPTIDHPTALRNMDTFKDGRHLVYYRPDRPDELREIVNYYNTHPRERDEIAEEGWRETVKNHGLASKIHIILEDVNRLRKRRSPSAQPASAQGAVIGSEDTVAPGLYFLMSNHLTLVHVDPLTGELGHGDPDASALNLALEISGQGNPRLVRISGPMLERTTVDLPGELTVVPLTGLEAALRLGEAYLSTETGGAVRLDAAAIGPWEQFRLHPVRLSGI